MLSMLENNEKICIQHKFIPDHTAREAAKNYATQAVSYALIHFNIELYWTDESNKKT